MFRDKITKRNNTRWTECFWNFMHNNELARFDFKDELSNANRFYVWNTFALCLFHYFVICAALFALKCLLLFQYLRRYCVVLGCWYNGASSRYAGKWCKCCAARVKICTVFCYKWNFMKFSFQSLCNINGMENKAPYSNEKKMKILRKIKKLAFK